MTVFHEGEIAVQEQANVATIASRVGRMINSVFDYNMALFLQEQRIAVISSTDAEGRVWASLLSGEYGFLKVTSAETLHIQATARPGDPLLANIQQNHQVGIIVIDFEARQRMRINGTMTASPDGYIVQTHEVYGNCPKYIHPRDAQPLIHTAVLTSVQGVALSATQEAWIKQADTFFIASAHRERGADASHRGGAPGFVHVMNSNTLEFPDYSGNKMFNTLGNLAVNPNSGLLFIDFANGGTLQLSGKATIIWDAERAAAFPGAERVVSFQIEQIIQSV